MGSPCEKQIGRLVDPSKGRRISSSDRLTDETNDVFFHGVISARHIYGSV